MSQEYTSNLFAKAKRIWSFLPRTSSEKLVYIDAKVNEFEEEHRNLWKLYTSLVDVLKNKDDKIKALEIENARLKDILETEDPVVINDST